MTRRCACALAVVALVVLVPGPAHAQSGGSVTLRGFGDAGLTIFSAGRSVTAILDRPSGPVWGGGVELGLPRHLFLSVSASRFRRTGHRVFVFENQVFPLTVPETITLTPLEVNAGYRMTRLARLRPYAGGGVGWHTYDETSAHSTAADDVHATHMGYQVLGGVETPMGRWLALAGEAQFASVPHALGAATTSVSSVYGEHDLGGFTVRVKVLIGR